MAGRQFSSRTPSAPAGGGGCGYRGVRMRSWGRWVSEIRLPSSRERVWLGSFITAEQAAAAFDAASFYLRGSAAAKSYNLPHLAGHYDYTLRSLQHTHHHQKQENAGNKLQPCCRRHVRAVAAAAAGAVPASSPELPTLASCPSSPFSYSNDSISSLLPECHSCPSPSAFDAGNSADSLPSLDFDSIDLDWILELEPLGPWAITQSSLV